MKIIMMLVMWLFGPVFCADSVETVKSAQQPVRVYPEDLVKQGAAGVDGMIKTLSSGGPGQKMNAIYALGHIRDKRAAEPLSIVLETDKNVTVRRVAAYYLAYFDTARTKEALKKGLTDSDEGVRVNSAKALGLMGDPSGYDVALAATHSKDTRIRQTAYYALAATGDERAKPVLEALKKDGDMELQSTAAYSLKQYEVSAAEKKARGKLFGSAKKARLEKLQEGLKDDNLSVRRWAMNSLMGDVEGGDNDSLDAMKGAAQDSKNKYRAEMAEELYMKDIAVDGLDAKTKDTAEKRTAIRKAAYNSMRNAKVLEK